jgi:putative addiction module killer protein
MMCSKSPKRRPLPEWFARLRDLRARTKVLARILLVGEGDFGDHKSVGDGVSEMRIHYGPGYRIYCTTRKKQTVILLAAGEKSSQSRDIELAKKLCKELEE